MTGNILEANEKFRADSGTNFGQQLRRGVIQGLAVTPNSGLAVDVSAGYVYFGSNAVTVATDTVTPSAADATDPRFDLVVVNNSGVLSIVEGTVDSNPVVPTFDIESFIPVARLNITAGLTTITTSEIKDTRMFNEVASGGWNPSPAFVSDTTEQLKISVSTSSTSQALGSNVISAIIKNGGVNTVFLNQGATAATSDVALAAGDTVVWSDSSGFNTFAAITSTGTSAIYVLGVR